MPKSMSTNAKKRAAKKTQDGVDLVAAQLKANKEANTKPNAEATPPDALPQPEVDSDSNQPNKEESVDVWTIVANNRASKDKRKEPREDQAVPQTAGRAEVTTRYLRTGNAVMIVQEAQNRSRDSARPPSVDASSCEQAAREMFCNQLRQQQFMQHDHDLFMHGRGYTGPLKEPSKTWHSDELPRDDHCDFPRQWLTASEFNDLPEVMAHKVRQVSEIMRLSQKTVIYTGAGISASRIGIAARGSRKTTKTCQDVHGAAAKPTFTHYALGLLGQQGLIHSWVQQNHDGLPQKAGFPQECINEIHGSWFDPSNPVVKYGGTLHDSASPWMCEDAATADLVLVLGTSLSGLTADQVATSCAQRSLRGETVRDFHAGETVEVVRAFNSSSEEPIRIKPGWRGKVCRQHDDGRHILLEFDELDTGEWVNRKHFGKMKLVYPRRSSLGTVCFNLQQTPQDGEMTLRLFGESDELLRLLLQELGLDAPEEEPCRCPTSSRVLVPYDRDGRRLREDQGPRMWLDLRDGQTVRLTPGHNIQGAKQPHYMHIGAEKPVKYEGRLRQPGMGQGVVRKRDELNWSFLLEIDGAQMRLGLWWLDAAVRGGVDVLPVVNLNPEFESDDHEKHA